MFYAQFFKKGLLALAVFMALALFPLAAEAGTLTIVNGSASDLDAIYISSSGTNNWEENILGGGTLPSGSSVNVQIQGSYSSFDLSVESSDGGEEDYYGFPGNTRRIVLRGGGDSEYQ